MKKPKAINLFLDMRDEFSLLSDQQVGRVVMALLAYAQDGEEPDFGEEIEVKLLFRTLKKQVDRDFAKYDEICRKRSEAGKKGGAPIGNTNASKSPIQANAIKTSQYEDEDENEDKNDDEDKNENKKDSASTEDERESSLKYLMQSSDIIFYLNQQAHTPLYLSDKSARDLITRRLKEGYTVDDLKRVIRRQCQEWLDTSNEENLRPDVLFGERFESYLGDRQSDSL